MKSNKKLIILIAFIIFFLIFVGVVMKQQLGLDTEMNSAVQGFYIIFFSILIFIAAIAIVPKVFGKKEITSEEFKAKMESKGYEVTDITSELTEYPYMIKAYSAINKEFKVEFYELKDFKYAQLFCSDPKLKLKLKNEYRVLSRINNTVVLIEIPTEYKGIEKTILKQLRY